MDDLSWERNTTSFPWTHHQELIEESFNFDSENIFLNPIQNLQNQTDSSIRAAGAGERQMVSHQLAPATAPARLESMNTSQYWSQRLDVNGFQKGKNVIPNITTTATATVISLESLDCLLSATNSTGDTSESHDNGISVIFPDYKNLYNSIFVTNNNNFSGSSSGDSVTKETTDDGIVSKRSPEKAPATKRTKITNGFHDDPQKPKSLRSDPTRPTSSNINFRQASSESDEPDSEAIAQMKEMIYRAAAFRPVSFAEEDVVEKPRRKNVRISNDPQTVAARQRRERISEKIRVLQKLVPGGNKMDTASMLDEAANYLKFLRSQVKALEQSSVPMLSEGQKIDYVSCGTTTNARSTTHIIGNNINPNNYVTTLGVPFNYNSFPMQTHFLLPHHHQNLYPNPPPA